jgi:hypothetical protein
VTPPDHSKRIVWDLDLSEPPPEFIGPRLPPCQLEDHRWSLAIEDGRPFLACLDPCSEARKNGMDTQRHGPMCDLVYEFIDSMHMEEVPVTLRIETEYYPGELGGVGETDAWLVARPDPAASDERSRP